ncbi:hypothetical protein ACFSUK_07700 [Sphingobium scionense]
MTAAVRGWNAAPVQPTIVVATIKEETAALPNAVRFMTLPTL